jgi:ATP-dependent protease ClpP protease subunit
VMIHLPWMEVAGSHNEITSHSKDLKATEDSFIKFYSECLQIDQNTSHLLLTNTTSSTTISGGELQ